MTTPRGGSPDEQPDAGGGRAPDPDPEVTSFSAPPTDPPPSWPGSPAPGRPPSRDWSEEGAPVDPAPPADTTAGWAPPAPADPTHAGWPVPGGGRAPGGGSSPWAPVGQDPWGPAPGWAPAAGPPGWGPPPGGPEPQPGGWGPPPGGPGPQPGGWGPPPGGPGPQPGGWAPPPGPQPTQIGTPWAQQPAWGAPPPGWGPPPPPRRTGRLVALIAVGVLLLAALGVGGYLLVRDTADGPAELPAGFRAVSTSALRYAVPPGWTDSPNAVSILGAPLEGRADAPGYTCGGAQYYRGLVAGAFVPGERPAAAVAAAFARETGQLFYQSADGAVPDVQVSAARPFDVDGVEAQLVEATSTTPVDDGCLATSGTVLLLAVPTTGPDGSPGTALLVVNGDTAGGPPSAPPLPDRATLEAVLDSARLPTI